jgi:hypothetical protein
MPVAKPTSLALHKRWIDDVRDVPARINLPVRIVVVGDLDEFAFAPVVLSEEHLSIAIEADQQKHVTSDVRGLVEDIANYFAVRQDGILQRGEARIVAKRTPTRRPVASVHPRQERNVLFTKFNGVVVLLARHCFHAGKSQYGQDIQQCLLILQVRSPVVRRRGILRNFLRNIATALKTGQRGVVLHRTRCRPRAVSVQSKRFAHMKDVLFGYIDEQTILASICRLQRRGTRGQRFEGPR